MVKNALILHAWYNHPQDHWYPWLKNELEKRGNKVFLPELPTMNTNLPDMKKQLQFIDELITIDENTIVIGHSLGCLLAMRLAEKHKYAKMFLVAGWDFDDLTAEHKLFWPNKITHELIMKNVKEIYCLSSDNDPYTTAFITGEMAKRFGGKRILIPDAGHFLKTDGVTKIPEVLQYI